jgi:lipopolysaccharide/colanic/teichoic acid biosynthesis glycosyltransferase
VGQYGKLFKFKLQSLIHPANENISKLGKFLRKSKIDELLIVYGY